jgi:hypothetical protein
MCGKEKQLIKAHLIPDSLKDFVFQKNGHFMSVALKSANGYKKQTFEFDKTILCIECDNKLGVYEKELKKLINAYLRCSLLNSKYDRNNQQCFVNECVPKRIFLAFVSILWKHSISNRSDIDLCTRYNEMFREWLINGFIPSEEMKFCDIYLVACLAGIGNSHLYLPERPLWVRDNGCYRCHQYYMGLWAVVDVGTKKTGNFPFPPIDIKSDKVSAPLVPFGKTIGSYLLDKLNHSSGLQK